MKKRQNVYKRKRNFNFLRTLTSVFFSALLVSFFALIGYSVAKPFGSIGEAKPEPVSIPDNDLDNVEDLKNSPENVRAYWLAETEITDTEHLERLLSRIGKSCNTAVIPMKISGGRLNYASSNEGAIAAGASGETDISEIIAAVRAKGLKPAASFNTMTDNLYPKAEKSAGFLYKKNGELWYDAAEKNGGKPWLSPSSDTAENYLCSLASEITTAGFQCVIATDMKYPKFSRLGLDDIGDIAAGKNRYLDLIDLTNKIAGSVKSRGGSMWIEISAAEMFGDKCEVFQPLMLDTERTVLAINLDDFRGPVVCGSETVDFSGMDVAQKVEKVCSIAETYIYKTSFIPEITGNISTADKDNAVKALEKMGYYSYVIR